MVSPVLLFIPRCSSEVTVTSVHDTAVMCWRTLVILPDESTGRQQVENSGVMVSSRQVINVVCFLGGFVLYGCETWSLALGEEWGAVCKYGAEDDMSIYGPKRV
jgi:hypothetical protein